MHDVLFSRVLMVLSYHSLRILSIDKKFTHAAKVLKNTKNHIFLPHFFRFEPYAGKRPDLVLTSFFSVCYTELQR